MLFFFICSLKCCVNRYKGKRYFNIVRVAHYGELAFECANAYYKYGCALLYKAQEEADPLGAMPKKEAESHENSNKDESTKKAVNGESSTTSVDAEQDGNSNDQQVAADDGKYLYP